MKNTNILIGLVLVVLVGAGSFFAGIKYQQSKGNVRQAGQFRNRTGGNANNVVRGQVISVDDKSATVKLQDGSSKIVLFSDSTQISKATTGQKTDITTGMSIMAFGTTNSDGSVTAQNIQLNPQGFMGGQGQRTQGQ